MGFKRYWIGLQTEAPKTTTFLTIPTMLAGRASKMIAPLRRPISSAQLLSLPRRPRVAQLQLLPRAHFSSTPAPNNDASPQGSLNHKTFYKTFGRPIAKVFLLAIFTYQLAYYFWVRLEQDEMRAEVQGAFPLTSLIPLFSRIPPGRSINNPTTNSPSPPFSLLTPPSNQTNLLTRYRQLGDGASRDGDDTGVVIAPVIATSENDSVRSAREMQFIGVALRLLAASCLPFNIGNSREHGGVPTRTVDLERI
ncbi:hypothetical protein F5B17DRAFT_429706 [Nemania serpens]|nr:hypothetical protein F5B17DRAFT_429706 [Nemania serpens]